MRMMARDYIGIPASACLGERAFSLSGRTDRDPTRRKMKAQKFGDLQQVKAGYRDGRLSAREEAWIEIRPDFDYDADYDSD